MVRTVLLLILLARLAAGQEVGREEKPDAKPAVRLVRDLTRLPPGNYEMVQTYDLKRSETLERPGAEPKKTETRTSNTFTFAVVVERASHDAPPAAVVTVRRVQIRVEGKQNHTYDSDGPAQEQSELLRTQFRHLVGRIARVDLAAFGRGKGFAGLDAGWTDYLKEYPDRSRWAEANRKNYGDGRLDRMFVQGLDLLFGPEAGRADNRTLELKRGQIFQVTLEEPGIGFEPTPIVHECRVQSVADGTVAITMAWKENGLRPVVDKNGAPIVRGGDIKCSATLTFRLDAGLLVGLKQEMQRTDQVAHGIPPVQRTVSRTESKEFTFQPK